jgi:hypothetical protein
LSLHAAWLLSIYSCTVHVQQADSIGMPVRDWWVHTHADMHEWLLPGSVNQSEHISCTFEGHRDILKRSPFNLLPPNRQKKSNNYGDWLRAEWSRGRSSVPGKVKNYFFSMSSIPLAKPVSYSRGTREYFPGIKRPVREADHPPSTSAEIKKILSYTSTPPPRTSSWRTFD